MAWLRFVEPLLKALGRFLLAHFRRIFPLFFQWTHSDDPETVLLVCLHSLTTLYECLNTHEKFSISVQVLERVETVLRLTWIGNSPRFNPKHYKRALRQTFFSACPPYLEATPRVCFYSLMKYTAGPKAYSSESAWRQYQDDPNLVTVWEYNMGQLYLTTESLFSSQSCRVITGTSTQSFLTLSTFIQIL